MRQGRSVVVLRTFSKVYGLAGARVGYGMGPAELINYFSRLKTAFIVNSVGEAGALAALDDREHYERAVRNNSAQLALLTRQLRELGYAPVESWGNFVYVETGEDASALGRRLQMNGIIVRPLIGSWGARTAIRVTVGSPEENRKFIDALKCVTKGAHRRLRCLVSRTIKVTRPGWPSFIILAGLPCRLHHRQPCRPIQSAVAAQHAAGVIRVQRLPSANSLSHPLPSFHA